MMRTNARLMLILFLAITLGIFGCSSGSKKSVDASSDQSDTDVLQDEKDDNNKDISSDNTITPDDKKDNDDRTTTGNDNDDRTDSTDSTGGTDGDDDDQTDNAVDDGGNDGKDGDGGTDQVLQTIENFFSIEANNYEEQFCRFGANQALTKLSFARLGGTLGNPAALVTNINIALDQATEEVTLTFDDPNSETKTRQVSRSIEVRFEVRTDGHPAIDQAGQVHQPASNMPAQNGSIRIVAWTCAGGSTYRDFEVTVPPVLPTSDTTLNEMSVVVYDQNGYRILPDNEGDYVVPRASVRVGVSALAASTESYVAVTYNGGGFIEDPSSIPLLQNANTVIELFVIAADGTVGTPYSIVIKKPLVQVVTQTGVIVSSNVQSEYNWRPAIHANDEDVDASPLNEDQGLGDDANTNTPRLRVQLLGSTFVQEINTEHFVVTGLEGSGVKVKTREGISRINDNTVEILLVATGKDENHTNLPTGNNGDDGNTNWPDYGDADVTITLTIDGSQFADNEGTRVAYYTFLGIDENILLQWLNDNNTVASAATDKDGILNGERLRLTVTTPYEWFETNTTNEADAQPISQLDEMELFNDAASAGTQTNYRILVVPTGMDPTDNANLVNTLYGIGINPSAVDVSNDANGLSKTVDLTIYWDGTEISENLDFYVEVYGKVLLFSQGDEVSSKVTFAAVKELTIALTDYEHGLDGAYITATLAGDRYFFDPNGPGVDDEWEFSGTAIDDYGVRSFTWDGNDSTKYKVWSDDIEILDEKHARIQIQWDGTDIDADYLDDALLIMTIADGNNNSEIEGLNLDWTDISNDVYDYEYIGPAELNEATGLTSNTITVTPEAETLTVQLINRHGSVVDLSEGKIDTYANAESAEDLEDGTVADMGFEELNNGQLQMILVKATLTGAIWTPTAANTVDDFGLFINKVDVSNDLLPTPGYTIDSVSRVSDTVMEVRVIGTGTDFDADFQLVLGVKGTTIEHYGFDGNDHITDKGTSANALGDEVVKINDNQYRTFDDDGDLYASDGSLLFTAAKENVTITAVNITEKQLTSDRATTAGTLTATVVNDKWSNALNIGQFSLVIAEKTINGLANDCPAPVGTTVSGLTLGAGNQQLTLDTDGTQIINALKETTTPINFRILWDSINGDFDSANPTDGYVSSDGNIYLQLKVNKNAMQDNEQDVLSSNLVVISAVDEKIRVDVAANFGEKGLDTASRETEAVDATTNVKLTVTLLCSIAKANATQTACGTTTAFTNYQLTNWDNLTELINDTDTQNGDADLADTATDTVQSIYVKRDGVLADYDKPKAASIKVFGENNPFSAAALTSGKGNEVTTDLSDLNVVIPVDDPVGTVVSVYYAPNGTFLDADNIDVTQFVVSNGGAAPGTLGGIHEYMVEGSAKLRITYQLTADGTLFKVDDALPGAVTDIPGLSFGNVVIGSMTTTAVTIEFDADGTDPENNQELSVNIQPGDLDFGVLLTAPFLSRSEAIRMPKIAYIAQDTN